MRAERYRLIASMRRLREKKADAWGGRKQRRMPKGYLVPRWIKHAVEREKMRLAAHESSDTDWPESYWDSD